MEGGKTTYANATTVIKLPSITPRFSVCPPHKSTRHGVIRLTNAPLTKPKPSANTTIPAADSWYSRGSHTPSTNTPDMYAIVVITARWPSRSERYDGMMRPGIEAALLGQPRPFPYEVSGTYFMMDTVYSAIRADDSLRCVNSGRKLKGPKRPQLSDISQTGSPARRMTYKKRKAPETKSRKSIDLNAATLAIARLPCHPLGFTGAMTSTLAIASRIPTISAV